MLDSKRTCSETIIELEHTRTNQYQDFLVPVFDFVQSIGRSAASDQKWAVWSRIWAITSCEATNVSEATLEICFWRLAKRCIQECRKTAQLVSNRNGSLLVCYTDECSTFCVRSICHYYHYLIANTGNYRIGFLALIYREVIVFRKLRSKCFLSTQKWISVR